MMKVPLFVLATFVTLYSLSSAEVTKLPPKTREILLQSSRGVQVLRSMKDIPAAVVQACAAVTPEHEFRLADPGERFQVTDVIVDASLLRRRLIWAARIPVYYLLHYEMGGRARSYHVILVDYGETRSNATVAWSSAAIPLKNYDEFLTAFKTGKLDDTLDYFH